MSSNTRFFSDKTEFTPEDLSALFGQEVTPEVAEKIIKKYLRRLSPGQILMPKDNNDPEKFLWMAKGSLVVGKMHGDPKDFVPVFTLIPEMILPLKNEASLEFRGGENGAILIALTEKLVSGLKGNPIFFERIMSGVFDTIHGIVKNSPSMIEEIQLLEEDIPNAIEVIDEAEMVDLRQRLQKAEEEIGRLKELARQMLSANGGEKR